MKKIFVGRIKKSALTEVLKDIIFFSCVKSLKRSDGCGLIIIYDECDLPDILDQLDSFDDDTLLLLNTKKVKELIRIMHAWPHLDFRFGNDEVFLVKSRFSDDNTYYFQTRERYSKKIIPLS